MDVFDIKTLINITRDEKEAYIYHKANGPVGNTDIARSIIHEALIRVQDIPISVFSRMSNDSLVNILTHFPDFTSAYLFVTSFKPGFIYTNAFTRLLKKYLIVKKRKRKYFGTLYKFANYILDSRKYLRSYANGLLYSETRYRKMDNIWIVHSTTHPSQIYYSNGILFQEQWYYNSFRHRSDGPSIISYHDGINIRSLQWLYGDSMHRIDGPACIRYYPNGNVEEERWYICDKNINLNGPFTIIIYYEDGSILKTV